MTRGPDVYISLIHTLLWTFTRTSNSRRGKVGRATGPFMGSFYIYNFFYRATHRNNKLKVFISTCETSFTSDFPPPLVFRPPCRSASFHFSDAGKALKLLGKINLKKKPMENPKLDMNGTVSRFREFVYVNIFSLRINCYKLNVLINTGCNFSFDSWIRIEL